MHKYLVLLFFVCLTGNVIKAQNPDDALRSAWFIPGGTARSMAIGGAMGSLGGDMSAMTVNPAGLGFYRTKELAISPAFNLNKNEFSYQNNLSAGNVNAFALGTSGYIDGGHRDYYDNNITHSYGFSFTQTAAFGNKLNYTGTNNTSSYSEQYLEELVRDGANIDAASNNYITGSSLAFFTYLIDSVADAQGNLIGYRSLVPLEGGIIQNYDETRSGGMYDISFGYGVNMNEKILLGASFNIPFSIYNSDLIYTETDPSDVLNNFNYSSLEQNFRSFGIGANLKLGIIYRPKEFLRFGFAFHTPSYMVFSDRLKATMTTDTEGYKGVQTKSSADADFGIGEWTTRDYAQLTPWRAIVSGSYVFRETQDTKLQRGFITADVEYVNYRGARFSQVAEDPDPAYDSYLSFANETNKTFLKGAINARAGAEIKFAPWAIRAGAAYYGNPYEDVPTKASRVLLSGGIGYRYEGMFLDLTYAYTMNKDLQFPYRLNDVPNSFAVWNNNRGQIMATVGVKL